MRLTQHEDGYIYGVFCSESKDKTVNDPPPRSPLPSCDCPHKGSRQLGALCRTSKTKSPQAAQLPCTRNSSTASMPFYTPPIRTASLSKRPGRRQLRSMRRHHKRCHRRRKVVSPRRCHTITESKNGAGAVPIKTEKGWIHLAHGVRNTAAGLRYVLYVFVTDLQDPAAHRRTGRLLHRPAGQKSASAMFPMSCSRTVPSLMTTARSTSTTLPPIHAYRRGDEHCTARLCVRHPGRPAAFRRLRPPALCPHREKSRIYESAQIISLKA